MSITVKVNWDKYMDPYNREFKPSEIPPPKRFDFIRPFRLMWSFWLTQDWWLGKDESYFGWMLVVHLILSLVFTAPFAVLGNPSVGAFAFIGFWVWSTLGKGVLSYMFKLDNKEHLEYWKSRWERD